MNHNSAVHGPDRPVRTRFAPSPTGALHAGNIRTAVLNWLIARHHGGAFLLRIEDTDVERQVPGAEAAILDDLRWLGLNWDEDPVHQSDRREIYREHADRLLEANLAFHCYCSREELDARRREAIERGENPHYDGFCLRLSSKEAEQLRQEGRRAAIRFHVPDDSRIVVEDLVRGPVEFAGSELGDFIIMRSDGLPTYNFAVVVDDALMSISHVIRGVGHLSNSPRQLLLYQALGYTAPEFAHVPTILGPDRQKLSKRHGARPISWYREQGYHPDAVVNYLSLLSWSSPTEDEYLPRDRLIEEISLDRIRAADAVFDPEKLRWLSSKHIEAMSIPALTEAVEPFVDRQRHPFDPEDLPIAVRAIRTHLSTFSDINEQLEPFALEDLRPLDEQSAEELTGGRAAEVIEAVYARLESLEEWTEDAIGSAVRQAGDDAEAGGRALYHPVRIAITGREHGPPLAAVMRVLGRERVLRRLERASSPETV